MSDVRVARARRWDLIWGLWLAFLLVVVPTLAWVQHLVAAAEAGRWWLCLLGGLVFPIGIGNGLGIWLGFWP
ncbi:hypothetical protein [Roseococcus sp.]|uniref:hypothetical protein n=1 Tax=Roseococcus sp. TaxID=2109646 RepID=UPI003BAC3DD1